MEKELPACPKCGKEQDSLRGDTDDNECHRCRSVAGCFGELDFAVSEHAAIQGPGAEFLASGLSKQILGVAAQLFEGENSDVLLVEKLKRHLHAKLGIKSRNEVAKLDLLFVAKLLDDSRISPDRKKPGRKRSVEKDKKLAEEFSASSLSLREFAKRKKQAESTVRGSVKRGKAAKECAENKTGLN